ncbi:Peptidase S11 D-alanyl-D-alanine carboxypeptidase A N-terminal domain-containing protein [Bordetella sputigena]|uniref:serine hydrolase n=1 Tax=Bordetella sputigena TaxID=1416810 RepID=UPI0039EE88BB
MPDFLSPLRGLARRVSAGLILQTAAATFLALPLATGASAADAPQTTKKSTAKKAPAKPVAAKKKTSKIIYRSRSREVTGAHGRGAARGAVATRTALELDAYAKQPFAPDGSTLHSEIAYMVDETTGLPLVDKDADAVVPIASITKLMMAMVVLDSGASLAEPIRVTDDDQDFEKHTGSRLRIGSVLSREDMLHIALMASENRAAAALSRYYPGGRLAFIAAMNAKARALGMTHTHFENVAGLSKYNVSTARDLVKMVQAAAHYPLIRLYSTDQNYTVNTGKGVLDYRSTNILLGKPDWEIGLQKTGFINESGICLVMQATVEGRPVVMVLLHSNRRHADFMDAEHLRTAMINNSFPVPSLQRNYANADARPM